MFSKSKNIRIAHLVQITLFLLAAAAPVFAAVELVVQADQPGPAISSTLYGIFFEEINHAGEGGLYAELIRNRSFEDNANTPTPWRIVATGSAEGKIDLDPADPLNSAQKYAMKIEVEKVAAGERVGASNEGFWGMNFIKGDPYRLSFYAKSDGKIGALTAALEKQDGSVTYAQTTVSGISTTWQKFEVTLTPNASDPKGRFVITAETPGLVWLDVVSLFPPTWKNRPNGLRRDLAEMIAAMRPKFVRFPGGCYVEGGILRNRFQWKQTIGDIAERPGHYNDKWMYRVQDGLGYHEFLQFAEDLGAAALFVVNVGLSCMYSANQKVPIEELNPYIQDTLDAIEYAIGDPSTTWGAKRAANGHPAPFPLRYIEVGNENAIQLQYPERYKMFAEVIRAKYPQIELIGNVDHTTDHPQWFTGLPVDYVDEHYYRIPTWFMQHATHYDNYDRNGPQVYTGEYAVALTPLSGDGNLISALGEAAFMTGMERNSDVVKMSSYAPLLVNENDRKWTPDAIVFDSSRVYGTPSYHVQQLFAEHLGDVYLPTTISNLQQTLYVASSQKQSTNEIIMKVVNVDKVAQEANIKLQGVTQVEPSGTVITLTSAGPNDENSFAEPTKIAPVTTPLSGLKPEFTYTFLPYSVTILTVYPITN